MTTRRRGAEDGVHDADPPDGAKRVFCILAIAVGVVWLAPAMLGDDPQAGDGGAGPSGAQKTEIMAALDDAEAVALAATDAVKYALTAAALVLIAVLRAGIRPA